MCEMATTSTSSFGLPIQHDIEGLRLSQSWSAKHELFYKTLGLFTALTVSGCSLCMDESKLCVGGDSESVGDLSDDSDTAQASSAAVIHCDGRMILREDPTGHSVLQYVPSHLY